ncbi:MAG: DUF5678 domain-containing protein [bacterium]
MNRTMFQMLPKEYNWLLNNPEIQTKYASEYIAIIGESVVAHGKDSKEVLKQAEKHGKEPFIHKVPSSDKELIV